MTAPISRALDPASPLARHLRETETLLDDAAAALRHAHLLRVTYWVSGPFPGATELIVTVDESNGDLALTAIKDAAGYRWTDDGGLSTCPEDYRTTDGADLDQLVDEIVLELDSLLGDNDPGQLWDHLDTNCYRVPLPVGADLDRITPSEPSTPDTGLTDVFRHLEALGTLRDRLASTSNDTTRRRDRSIAHTPVIRDIFGAVAELEQAAIAAKQHRLRVEVVVDRDPDGGTQVATFVDGVPHRSEVTVVDPGAGHQLTDWRKTGRRLAEAASPHAAAHIRGWFDAYENSEFISR